MNEPTVLFTKLQGKSEAQFLRIKTEWEQDYFRLFIIEGSLSWFALVTKEHIDKLAEQHEIEPTVYLKNLREYICTNQTNITLEVANRQFIVYRSLEKQKLRVKYFFVKLEKLNHQETVEILLDELIEKYTNSLKRLTALEEQKLQSDSQKLLVERKLEDFIDLKRKGELQMYSAFLLLLNEKKHRIRYLTEQLEEYQVGRKPDVSITTKIKKEPEKCKLPILKVEENSSSKPRETISESDSNGSDGYNTDEEKSSKIYKEIEPVAGTSRDNLDFLGGDSPPPVLPKRLKREKSKTYVATNSATDMDINKNVQTSNGIQETATANQPNSDEDSPSMEFDTQDLLDRM